MQRHFCKLVCASFPCWVDFFCSQLRGLQLTPIQSSAKSSVKAGGRKMPAGYQERKKGKSWEIRQSLWVQVMKRHFMDRASSRAERLQRLRRRAGTVRAYSWQDGKPTRLGQAGARQSPWPRGQSARVVTAAARTQGQEGKRVNWKAFLLPEEEPRGSQCCPEGADEFRNEETEPSNGAGCRFPSSPCIFSFPWILKPFGFLFLIVTASYFVLFFFNPGEFCSLFSS